MAELVPPVAARLPLPLLFAASFALGWSIDRWIGDAPAILATRPVAWAGLLLTALSLILAAASMGHLLLRRTSIHPAGEPSRLVTGGVYSLSRNPAYLSLLLLHAGLALVLAAPVALVMLVPLLVVIERRVIPFEESMLSRRFGADFDAYRRHVRRWV